MAMAMAMAMAMLAQTIHGQTLTELERKLALVEDSQFHHQQTIAHDDSVLVSGRMIRCCKSVSLVLGPVIGTVGQDSVRIMVETAVDAEIVLHFFLLDELLTDARFVCTAVSVSRHVLSHCHCPLYCHFVALV
jgi:hypothetical protein